MGVLDGGTDGNVERDVAEGRERWAAGRDCPATCSEVRCRTA